MSDPRRAILEPRWLGIITSRRALTYADGSDASLDRPSHVRAGSSLAWIGGRIAVVQDDANFIALVDVGSGAVRAVSLPRGKHGARLFDDERGNKAHKLDLEACVAIPGDDEPMLLAMGSGSKRRRRNIVRVDRWASERPRVRLTDAAALYVRLERERRFAGSDMNIEGALLVDGAVRLFARGNGAARNDEVPRNATCDLSLEALLAWLDDPGGAPPPEPTAVAEYALGSVGGVALGFTDAAAYGDDMLYTASAEQSADASLDGVVTGSALGLIPRDGGTPRYVLLTNERGTLLTDKVEGLLVDPLDPKRLHLIIDGDDPSRPSELCDVELRGAWAM